MSALELSEKEILWATEQLLPHFTTKEQLVAGFEALGHVAAALDKLRQEQGITREGQRALLSVLLELGPRKDPDHIS